MAYLYHLETLQINKLINKVTINDVILVHKVSRLSFHDTHYLSIIGLDRQTGMTSTQQTDRQTLLQIISITTIHITRLQDKSWAVRFTPQKAVYIHYQRSLLHPEIVYF